MADGLPRWQRAAAVRVLIAVLLPVSAVLLMAPTALAQQEEQPVLFGTLRSPDREVSVEGVRILAAQDGDQVGAAQTGADGRWEIALPEPGTYTVTIVQDSLPEGIEVREADRFASKEVEVRAGERQAVLFPLQRGGTSTVSRQTLRRVVTLTVSGIQLGSIIAITSIGLSLIFGTTGLVNFAHGEMVTLGAVTALFLNGGLRVPASLAALTAVVIALAVGTPAVDRLPRRWSRPARAGGATGFIVFNGAVAFVVLSGSVTLHVIPAGVVAVAVGAAVGFGMEAGLFGPLRRRRVGNVALLVISIGLSILLRYGILVVMGGQSYPYRDYTIQRGVSLGPIRSTPKDLVVTALSLAVLVVVGLLLTRTRLGTAMRAVADNRELAESSGVDVRRVILVTWVAGGALAALGGVFQGMVQAVAWNMGFGLLLLMFAGVILGGLGTAFGAMAGGLLVGIIVQVSTVWFSVDLKLVMAFAVLILVLLFRPQGLLGRRERIG